METGKEIPTINVNASKDDSTSEVQTPSSDKPNAMKLSQSSSEIGAGAVDGLPKSQKDLSLNLSGSHSETTLKQLKTLTSPLSKLAKGMQNLGMAFDPRKKINKVSHSFSLSLFIFHCILQVQGHKICNIR